MMLSTRVCASICSVRRTLYSIASGNCSPHHRYVVQLGWATEQLDRHASKSEVHRVTLLQRRAHGASG